MHKTISQANFRLYDHYNILRSAFLLTKSVGYTIMSFCFHLSCFIRELGIRSLLNKLYQIFIIWMEVTPCYTVCTLESYTVSILLSTLHIYKIFIHSAVLSFFCIKNSQPRTYIINRLPAQKVAIHIVKQ